jgi:predicted dehydrogenase
VRGWRSIIVTDGDQPYMNKWWVGGLGIGYEHSFVHQVADFLKSLEDGTPCSPTFKEALQTQKVCEAVIDSANSKRWKDTDVDGDFV